ncbi:CD225/dispanin family protein [Pseudoxanthomonas putridarboris]|uniref:CD225/dispanin family protein n=1 Tax=Pseudoxanthomonas putridarboris TaxID=752605 RepID=A0ABU9J4F4_9GAMM
MSAMPPLPDTTVGNIPNHLGWSIAVTIIAAVATLCTCCGLGAVPGIVAIVFSAQVNGKLRNGDPEGARNAAKVAKILCWATAGFALLCLVYLAWSIHSAGGIGQMESIFEEAMEQARRQQR